MTWCTPKGTPFQSRHSLPKMIWSMFGGWLFLAAIPLGYFVSEVAPSGSGAAAHEAFIDASAVVHGNASCSGSLPVLGCGSCFGPLNTTDPVCFKTTPAGPFAQGVATTFAGMCAACPTGCGPFRNLDSMVRPLKADYATWPVWLKAGIDFCGTVPFFLICFFVVLAG